MSRTTPLILILILSILAACSPQPDDLTNPTVPERPVILSNADNSKDAAPETEIVREGSDADVRYVRAEWKEDGTWTFSVTVAHPDTGWEDYADGWDVVLPNGTVIKTNESSPFTRLLTHPHENEQPFTRSQFGLEIPEDVTEVTVRAHDLVDGFGGNEIVVRLDKAKGKDFEVIRPGLEPVTLMLGLTHQRPDGNRYLPGTIDLANTQPVSISLLGVPNWVVGVQNDHGGVMWLVTFPDGKMQAVTIKDGVIESISLSSVLPPGMPPAIASLGDTEILNYGDPAQGIYTHPIRTTSGTTAYLTESGSIILNAQGKIFKADANALPDARILSNGENKLLVLSDPTPIYTHGVLGDSVEANSITLLDESGQILTIISIPNDRVVEGIMPIWADLNGDSEREIVVTVSDAESGARLMAYSEDGSEFASSTPIGTGYRWRNQMAVAPFGPNGEIELVDVLTPHLSGTVEFFQLNGNNLERVAWISGYTSHSIGSRNLDMGLAADLDADGQVEVLLPNLGYNALGIIKHTPDGAAATAEITLNGKLTTNLSGISLSNGSIAIAAGTDQGEFLIWMP